MISAANFGDSNADTLRRVVINLTTQGKRDRVFTSDTVLFDELVRYLKSNIPSLFPEAELLVWSNDPGVLTITGRSGLEGVGLMEDPCQGICDVLHAVENDMVPTLVLSPFWAPVTEERVRLFMDSIMSRRGASVFVSASPVHHNSHPSWTLAARKEFSKNQLISRYDLERYADVLKNHVENDKRDFLAPPKGSQQIKTLWQPDYGLILALCTGENSSELIKCRIQGDVGPLVYRLPVYQLHGGSRPHVNGGL